MAISQQQKSESYVTVSEDGGMNFVGIDAVKLYQAAAVRIALGAYAKTGMQMNRGFTPTKMLATATSFTGKKYRRGEYLKAAEDLRQWCLTMTAALPVVEG
jgi:hypothetical protein